MDGTPTLTRKPISKQEYQWSRSSFASYGYERGAREGAAEDAMTLQMRWS